MKYPACVSIFHVRVVFLSEYAQINIFSREIHLTDTGCCNDIMVSASNQWCFQIPTLANVEGLSRCLHDDSCVVSNGA